MANSSMGTSSQFAGPSSTLQSGSTKSRYWGEEAKHFATAPLSPETSHVLMVVTTDQDQRREAKLLRYMSEGEALEGFRQLVKSSTLPPLDSSDVIYMEIDSLTTPKATRYTLDTLLGEEENVKKLYNSCEGRKISYSQTYKNIVRDLLVLHMKLRKVGLSMKFDLGSIGMSVDYYLGMDHYTVRALNLKAKSEREQDDDDGLIMLINNMNVRAGITLEMVENSLELKKVIDGLRGLDELRVDDMLLVFFWDHNMRVNFIEAVHNLFQNKSSEFYIKKADAAHLSHFVESLFETNWETSFDSDPMLRLLRQQDFDDRVRFGITQLVEFDNTPQHLRKEIGLRNTVDLMRQTNYHLVRMTKDLLKAGEINRGIDEYELELRFEKAFPNILQKLVDALFSYMILLGCRVRRFELSSHGSSFVIE